jgi:Trk K+ transport system NAD-binding subunit
MAATSTLANQTLAEVEFGPRWGITVLACANGGRINLRPGADTLIEPGMRLIVLGTRDQLQELFAAAGQPVTSSSLASPDTRSSR